MFEAKVHVLGLAGTLGDVTSGHVIIKRMLISYEFARARSSLLNVGKMSVCLASTRFERLFTESGRCKLCKCGILIVVCVLHNRDGIG